MYSQDKKSLNMGIIISIIILAIGLYFVSTSEINGLQCVNQYGETIKLSQISESMSWLEQPVRLIDINRNELRQAVNSNMNYQYISLQYGLDIQTENAIQMILSVVQRQPSCYINFNDVFLIIDQQGLVINLANTETDLKKLVKVNGLRINGYMLGQKITTIEPSQLGRLSQVFKAVENTIGVEAVQKIDLTNTLDIYMLLNNGVKVELGGIQHIEEKMRWLAVSEINEYCLNNPGGVLDLSIVGEPAYHVLKEDEA